MAGRRGLRLPAPRGSDEERPQEDRESAGHHPDPAGGPPKLGHPLIDKTTRSCRRAVAWALLIVAEYCLSVHFVEGRGTAKGNGMAWLRVRLDKGMFSDEFAVTYPASANFQKSVFVPRNYVRQGGEHQGEVQVNVVEKDGERFAVLPTARRDIVRVEDADLHP